MALRGIIVVGGREVEEVIEWSAREEMEAWRRGWNKGLSLLGWGDVGLYLLEDLEELDGSDSRDAKIVELIRKHLG